MDFKNGRRYRLMKDIKNSRHDHRYKNGTAPMAWHSGMVFYCAIRAIGPTFGDKRGYCQDPVDVRHPDFANFSAALEELPESTDDALSCIPAWGPEDASMVLDVLVKQGKLSLDDVRAAVAQVAKES